jgi:hypothetical protein
MFQKPNELEEITKKSITQEPLQAARSKCALAVAAPHMIDKNEWNFSRKLGVKGAYFPAKIALKINWDWNHQEKISVKKLLMVSDWNFINFIIFI